MLVHVVMASVPSNGGLNNISFNTIILLSILLDFAFIFKGFVSFTKLCTLLSEIYISFKYSFYDDCTGTNVWDKYIKLADNSNAVYTSLNGQPTLLVAGYNSATDYRGGGIGVNWNHGQPFSISYDVYCTNYWNWLEVYASSSIEKNLHLVRFSSSTEGASGGGYHRFPYNTWVNVKIEFTEDYIKIFTNNVLKNTVKSPENLLNETTLIKLHGSYKQYYRNILIETI